MNRSLRMTCLVASILALSVIPSQAAPSDVIKTRVDGFKALGGASRGINEELKTEQPDIAKIREFAATIHDTPPKMAMWFPAGSGPESGIKTRAMAKIWTNAAEFRAAQDGLAKQADVLQKTVMGTDLEAIRSEARKLGAACKACHDNFREPEEN